MIYLCTILACCSVLQHSTATIYTEDTILELVRRYIPVNPVILEAGSHYGEDTAKMKKMWPASIIHAFEPHPDNYQRLVRTVQGLPGIYCYPLALGETNGTAKFYRCRLHEGASSLLQAAPFKYALYNDQTPIMVQTMTLDDWARLQHVHHIDFCWLDMEGYELRMLQHAETILPTVKAIYIEVNFQEFRVGMVQYQDIKHFLITHGFREVWMTPGKAVLPEHEQANVLFVRNELGNNTHK